MQLRDAALLLAVMAPLCQAACGDAGVEDDSCESTVNALCALADACTSGTVYSGPRFSAAGYGTAYISHVDTCQQVIFNRVCVDPLVRERLRGCREVLLAATCSKRASDPALVMQPACGKLILGLQ